MVIVAILVAVVIALIVITLADDDPTTSTLPGDTTTSTIETTTTGDGTTTTGTGDTTTTVAGDTTTTSAGTTTTAGGGTTTTVAGDTTTTAEPPPPAPDPIAGAGSATIAYAIPDDLAAALGIEHDGAEDFVVVALDAAGDEIATLVERQGEYSGTVGVNLDPESEPVATLDITADGNWSATTTYIDDLEPTALAGLTGEGDSLFRLDSPPTGEEQAAFTHDGDGDFVVTVHSEEGAPTVLIETSGPVTETASIPGGSSVLTIVADGNWTITTPR